MKLVLSGHPENTFQYLLKRGMCLTLISRMTGGILKSASNYWVCGQYPTAQPFKSVKSFSAILSNLDLGHLSEKVSTVEPLQSLSYDHLFCMLLRPYIFLTQTQKSLSHFIILKTTLMQPPRYNDQGFIPLTVVALMGFYHTRPFIRKILDWRFLIYLSLCPFKGGFHILYKRCFYD